MYRVTLTKGVDVTTMTFTDFYGLEAYIESNDLYAICNKIHASLRANGKLPAVTLAGRKIEITYRPC